MHSLLLSIAKRLESSASRPLLTPDEARVFATLPALETLNMLSLGALARGAFKPEVFTCGILNAKSGKCPENCSFCAQSAHWHTQAPVYPLVGSETLLRHADELAQAGALRFGIVTSGTALNDRDFDALCRAVENIVHQTGIGVCGSLGQLTKERATQLRQAGLTRYHHNLETAASHFAAICTTHPYEDDLQTLRAAKAAGLQVCSGGILGLGETPEQRVELALTLAAENVDSVPLNFLQAIPGTPLENAPRLAPMEALRSIALFRLLMPACDILVCGGRTHVLDDLQSWLFAAGANGLMTGNYLTTPGRDFDADNALIAALGLSRRTPKARRP